MISADLRRDGPPTTFLPTWYYPAYKNIYRLAVISAVRDSSRLQFLCSSLSARVGLRSRYCSSRFAPSSKRPVYACGLSAFRSPYSCEAIGPISWPWWVHKSEAVALFWSIWRTDDGVAGCRTRFGSKWWNCGRWNDCLRPDVWKVVFALVEGWIVGICGSATKGSLCFFLTLLLY